jgi:hypothetical protein
MGREKDRKLNRRRRRVTKLRKLKKKLANSTDPKKKQNLTEKIRKISFYPIVDGQGEQRK